MKNIFSLFLVIALSGQVFSAVHVVTINTNFYDPSSITINEGDVVRFEWVSGTHPTESVDAYWTTFTLGSGNTFKEITFNDPGVYNYFCQFHVGMTGTINVQTVTGTVPVTAGKIKMYPNPAVEKVNIDLNGEEADMVEVRSLCGHTVKSEVISEPKTSLNVDLPHGEYILILKRRGEIIESKKLLVGN